MIQRVGLARSQKTFCFLAFSLSCGDFAQAASPQRVSFLLGQLLLTPAIIFILVLVICTFSKGLLNLPKKSSCISPTKTSKQHGELVKFTAKPKHKYMQLQ